LPIPANSPGSALIVGVVWCWLGCKIPVRLSLHTVHNLARLLRTTVIPQEWPACRGDARGFGVDADVIQNLVDVGTEGDENEVSAKTNLYSSYVAAKAMMRIWPPQIGQISGNTS